MNSCKNCIHYNNGDGELICNFCDYPFSDYFEESENNEQIRTDNL